MTPGPWFESRRAHSSDQAVCRHPAGTPPAIVGKLEKALAETVAQAEVRKRLAGMGTLVSPMNAKEFGAFIQSEMAKWRDAVKTAKLKIE